MVQISQEIFNSLPWAAVGFLGDMLKPDAQPLMQTRIETAAGFPRRQLQIMHHIKLLRDAGAVTERFVVPEGFPPKYGRQPHVFRIGDGTSSVDAAWTYQPGITEREYAALLRTRPAPQQDGWPGTLSRYVGEPHLIVNADRFTELERLVQESAARDNSISVHAIDLAEGADRSNMPTIFDASRKYVLFFRNIHLAGEKTLNRILNFMTRTVLDERAGDFGIWGSYRVVSAGNPIRMVFVDYGNSAKVAGNIERWAGRDVADTELGVAIPESFEIEGRDTPRTGDLTFVAFRAPAPGEVLEG
jgi:hypothetical protein